MRFCTILLMTLTAAACDRGSDSRRNEPEIPTRPHTVQPDHTSPGQPVCPTVSDSTPPKVVGVRQEGLEKIVVDFSEPIKRIDYISTGHVFSGETWSGDRKTLFVPFDVKKIRSGSLPTLTISGMIDDAGNRENQPVSIPVDHLPPVIEGIKIIDSRNVLVTFNEKVKFTDQSSFLVDGRSVGTIVPDSLTAQQATIRFSDIDFSSPDSHLFTATQLTDQYGNLAAKRSRGFAQSADKDPPRIVSVKQIPSKHNGRMAFLAFELEFSEYVVDSRDSDGGLAGELDDLLDKLKTFTINGKETINILGEWIPRADHRGGTLYWPALSFEASLENNKENTIGLTLTDALGNSQLATASLVVDSEAPMVQGNPYENEQCEMSGLRGFRCRISESDVASAVLKPEATWPAADYVVSTSSETNDGKEQHWLNFTFEKDVLESRIEDIVITDRIGNTNEDLIARTIRYSPTSARPQIVKATAFSNSILELEFSADVGSIETILVDGQRKEFKMTFVDNFEHKYKPANVVVHFAEPVVDGIHKVEIKGAARIRNKAARTEHLALDNLDNRSVDILQSSMTQEPDLWRTTDLRLEVTRPYTGPLLAFAAASDANNATTTAFTDFTLTPEGVTSRGTYAFRLHKITAAGLQPLEYTQGIILQIPGRPAMKKVYTTWSTEEPRFYLLGYAKPDGFIVNNLVFLDLDSLDVEIVSADQVISVERSWISPYLSEDERDLGFKVNLPENIRLKKSAFFYKLRVKQARTVNFGIELTKPFEARLTVVE